MQTEPKGYDVIRVVWAGEDAQGAPHDFVEYVPAEGLIDCNVAAEEQAKERLALRRVKALTCIRSEWGKFVPDVYINSVHVAEDSP